MKLHNLRLPVRMSLGFGSVLLLLTAIVVVSTLGLLRIGTATDQLIDDDWVKAAAVMQFESATRATVQRSLQMLVASDAATLADLRQRIESQRREADLAITTLRRLVRLPEGKALLASLDADFATYAQAYGELDAELRAGRREAAVGVATTAMMPRFDALLKQIEGLSTLQTRLAKEGAATVRADVDLAAWLVPSLGAAAVLAGLVFAVLLTRSVTVPVRESVALARRVAEGDLSTSIHTDRRDELGDLQRALSDMSARLSKVVGTVRANADSVATASGQIAQGNADLSQRTEEQASALQQTAASMEQLGSTVRSNAENSRQASQLALGATAVANEGGKVVGRVVETMQGIHASSSRIGEIIGTIDGIAFQTNILALNASVEAARAGEHGRGFAVVAGEVRSLAQRSSAAAREIRTLITSSVEQVEQGTSLVGQAGRTMEQIVASVQRVADIVSEISASSAEQDSGVGQIGQAVGQMDQVTQQNAALVEESAAAAESLKMQAGTLVQAVAVFRLAA